MLPTIVPTLVISHLARQMLCPDSQPTATQQQLHFIATEKLSLSVGQAQTMMILHKHHRTVSVY